MNLNRLPLYLSLLLLTQCSKCKDDPTPADPASLLPPATQTGANTFGCLINGQAYSIGLGPNLDVEYDPTFKGGYLSIGTYRVLGPNGKILLGLDGAPFPSTGMYSLDLATGIGEVIYVNTTIQRQCQEIYGDGSLSYKKGTLTITRLDLQARVISGTFDLKFVRTGCDTIRLTQGRFDCKM